ncbi:hypothetical protein D0466_21765 [Peribacillus glennii]|uniref:Secreted protein n=2 Tax=Peribacillus glennii TaxID=2303991 RepID=A0A372L752_9BACI|nr:hypothetical protein D0466_21765 [Peribacillus glennii]
MHFRQYILNSLIFGAVLFSPLVAHAEKADVVKKLPVQVEKAVAETVTHAEKKQQESKLVANIQKVTPAKKDKFAAKPTNVKQDKLVKAKKPLPDQADQSVKHKRQAGGTKINHNNKQTVPARTASKPETVPARTLSKPETVPARTTSKPENKTGLGWTGKKPTAVQSNQTSKGAAVEQTIKRPKTVHPPKLDVRKPKILHTVKTEEKKVSAPNNAAEIVHKKTNQKPKLKIAYLNKQGSIDTGSERSKSESMPLPDKGDSIDMLVIVTAPANDHSGGVSKDRPKFGHSTASANDKWFECENQWIPGIGQSFVSISNVFSSQWTNAPPLQPPIIVPFS